ncbi:Protein of unknown function [Gryllus bimaculatus]|nr:Protein of unknown function [Gryllus bimaculatus]
MEMTNSLRAVHAQLTVSDKVSRWFELQPSLSRPESGFVDEQPEHHRVDWDAAEALLLKRLRSGRRRHRIPGLRLGRVTTF